MERMTTVRLKGAEILVETLIAHGVNEVFGFPGGSVIDIYDALYGYRDRITHYLTCHEQGAAHAADGYARATGRTGVVIATSGPGATNLVTGIATAYLDSTPMVAITGNVSLPLIGKDSFQEVDIAGITMSITKHNYIVQDVADLEANLCEAFQIARSGRPGPVLVDIPKDVQQASCEFNGASPWPLAACPRVDDAALREAARLIDECRRPYIYAGGGIIASDASNALDRFARRIDAPVGLSIMGLSALAHDNPFNLGLTGMHGLYAASKVNADADLVIGVGVRFSDRATGSTSKYQENRRIIHIDIDGAEIDKNIDSFVSLLGNAAELLPRLTRMVSGKKRPGWQAQVESYRAEARSMGFEQGFTPRAIIHAVREHCASDTVVATDVGQHQMWVAQYYGFSQPRSFLTSGGLGTMGFGLGAAIGASVAKGRARTVLFSGDGSFHMNMNELATAVTYGLPIVVVVLNNQALGMVRQWQALFYDSRYSTTSLSRATDYPALAAAFGARGYRATDMPGLHTALDAAFRAEGPTVIECLIDVDEKVLPIIPPGGSVADMIIG
jgi:acetolactate synthase-1/2/3 large subunit